jgi:hypothetical protein
VKAGPKGKGAIRFFALYGVLCSIFFLFYVVGTNAVAIHGDSWPKDTLERSYFTNYVCGPDTGYACPGQGTPIPRDKSAHLDLDGGLIPGQVDPAPPVTFAP